MSKFCTSCGAQLADDVVFCTSCGARQDVQDANADTANSAKSAAADLAQAAGNLAHSAGDTVKQTFDGVTFDSVRDAMNVDSIKNVAKTKDKNTIIGISAIVIVLIVIIILLASLLGGGYEKPIKSYIKAVKDTDGDALMESLPPYMIDMLEENFEDYYDDEYDTVEEYFEDELLKDTLDELEDEYGDHIKISYKIKDKEKLSKKKLKNAEDDIEAYYDESVDISKGYELKVEIRIKGSDDDDEDTTRLNVYKIDGKWCIADMGGLL